MVVSDEFNNLIINLLKGIQKKIDIFFVLYNNKINTVYYLCCVNKMHLWELPKEKNVKKRRCGS